MENVIVLTAPPASGKTHLISALANAYQEAPLVLAPLRALVDECKSRWLDSVIVMTPEEWLVKGPGSKVVIIDEFHLNFYWGDTFRFSMWEAFYAVAEKAETLILLTATLNQEAIAFLEDLSHLAPVVWIDHGNQKLKNKPTRYFKLSNRNFLERYAMTLPQSSLGNLIFCQYREEVNWWKDQLERKGFSVWSCLGGEAGEFAKKVNTLEPPQFIVATTVLSHGVNLPLISNIFITYPIKNLDFWIQMIARGGRRGESFSIYALEPPHDLKWNKMTNFLAIQFLELKMEFNIVLESVQSWFLKASSSTKPPIKKGISS